MSQDNDIVGEVNVTSEGAVGETKASDDQGTPKPTKLDVKFGTDDLNLLVDKLNEVIEYL